MQLYIGNKNYSSWSLRAWLMLAKSGVSFDEVMLELDTPEFYQTLAPLTPSQKVPLLIDNDITVWDSLAICEYINDAYLNGTAWPEDLAERAKARALAAEMHSGFNALRNEMPMNIRATRHVELSEAALKDIARIDTIFAEQMQQVHRTQGGWLFGQWSIVDCMYAPVVLRLKTYQINLSDDATCYLNHVLASEALKRWIDAALLETTMVQADEAGTDV
ncbi:glutathione S-transferase family protein [Pseudoalteromonas tunicata]|uniref:glutathione S-transferase family protein n=1 Tax=Pseudoalteromonas tunicata TaxID=314281 RepID=UPI0027402B6E|nr:glutathione S-transferase family protein [Pseudoalteromonas tunicata]MDP5212885.1 glutathione S-transferase family protein [Pseudoalteromonas tunicata]